MINLVYEDLKKLQNIKFDEATFVFDGSTKDLTHVNLSNNSNLKEIRFNKPQPNLKYLDASHCALEKIVFSHGCKQLKVLYLHHNALVDFKLQVALPALELLDLSFNNNLSTIAFGVALPKLSYLYLHQCNFSDLGDLTDYFLRKGFDFNIDENKQLVNPAAAIVAQGKEAVIRQLRKIREDGKAYLYEAKLLILGDPRAGKTTLARKLLDTAAAMPIEEETTKGIVLATWPFKHDFIERGKQNLLVNIWDFGGQAIYKQTHRFFLTQRSVYVVLSDGGKSEKTDFPYWLYQTKTFGKDSPVIIFINEKENRKFDLAMNDLRKINPELKEEMAVNLKNAGGDDNKRFTEAVTIIKRQLVSLKHLGEEVSTGQKKIREHLLSLENSATKMIGWGDFVDTCIRFGETDPAGQVSLAEYFHDIGILLHFHDDDILRKHVFIDKQWILNGAYRVIDDQVEEKYKGKMTKAEFDLLFSGAYDMYRAEIKALLKRFYLIYEKDHYYVIPQHLQQNAPEYDFNFEQSVQFNFAYKEYMPAGILWQLIAEYSQYIIADFVWRRGVVLNYNKAIVEVIEEYGKDIIRIRVGGENKEDVRAVMIHALERINSNFGNLEVKREVPCICEECMKSISPFLFDYDVLKRMVEKGIESDRCNKSLDMISVSKLLRGFELKDRVENKIDRILKHVTETDKKTSLLIIDANLKRALLPKNLQVLNDHVITLLEKAGKVSKEEAFYDFKTWVNRIENKEVKAEIQKTLDNDQVDITAKFKFITPMFVREFFGIKAELEFSKKEKMPRNWQEFKALFVKEM